MDSQTAAKARDKARMIGKSSHHPNYPITFTLYYSLWSLLLATKIGYPDYITNTTDIDLYYAKYELGNHYFESIMNYRLFLIKKAAEKLDKPSDPNK